MKYSCHVVQSPVDRGDSTFRRRNLVLVMKPQQDITNIQHWSDFNNVLTSQNAPHSILAHTPTYIAPTPIPGQQQTSVTQDSRSGTAIPRPKIRYSWLSADGRPPIFEDFQAVPLSEIYAIAVKHRHIPWLIDKCWRTPEPWLLPTFGMHAYQFSTSTAQAWIDDGFERGQIQFDTFPYTVRDVMNQASEEPAGAMSDEMSFQAFLNNEGGGDMGDGFDLYGAN